MRSILQTDARRKNPKSQIPNSKLSGYGIRRYLAGCAWLLGFGVWALCACVGSTRPTIKIALVAPFEGRYREIGEEIIYAVRLAVREANERGGVNGYSIELMAYDDRGDPVMADEQARKLVTDPQVVGVIGNWLDATTLVAAPVYAAAGLPFLATTTSPDLDPAAFRLWLTESAYLAAAPDSSHCPLPCDSLESLDWFQSEILNLKSEISGPPLWGLNQFIRLTGDSADGVFVITPSPLPVDSADPTFTDRYRAISPGPQPRFLAVLAYDATNLLLEAIAQDIQSNKMPTRAGVESAIVQIDYTGLGGRFSFDAERDWEAGAGWVYEWRAGELVKP